MKTDVKVVLIGGGSYGWTHKFITDIACLPALHGMHIVLHDINEQALAVVLPLCRKISDALGANLRLEATTDLDAALPGADFVGLTISTAGEWGNEQDVTIPQRYGILQTVGDTVGPGGWSRALRNIPVVVDIIRAVERLAPNAWFMNYSNPMTVLTRVLRRTSPVKSVGLCHELQGLMLHMAYYFGVDWQRDIKVRVGGINHLIYVTAMTVKNADGLAMLREYAGDPNDFQPPEPRPVPDELAHAGGVNPHQKIKLDMLRRTGMLPAAGDGHTAEFFSHYLRNEETAAYWGLGTHRRSHTFAYDTNMDARRREAMDLLEGRRPLWLNHSHEHASRIIAALLGAHDDLVTPVNLPNEGQIDNLPREAVVETQAVVNAAGIQPIAVGSLPPIAIAHLMQHVPVQEMIVQAGLTGDRDLAIQALACDPLVPDHDTARKLADDYFETFRDWLPQFNGKWTWQ